MKVAFRVDASEQIGTGHAVRCRTLARVLLDRGASVLFVMRHLTTGIREALEADGCRLALLPEVTRGSAMPGAPYAAWLGVDEDTDAAQTRDALLDFGPDALVVDHYALSQPWENALRPQAGAILAIDDIARPHACDVVLDQNFAANPMERYKGRVRPDCRLLLGPAYALLQSNYADAATRVRTREGAVRRVAVFFGGSDNGNMTGKTLEALSDRQFDAIAADIVIGSANAHADGIAALARERDRTQIHRARASLADLFAAADLAVGAGGATTWERCCCGVPSLVVSIADNQVPASSALAEAKLVLYLGDQAAVDVARLRTGLKQLIDDPATRTDMSERGRLLVDGRGAHRVADTLMSVVANRAPPAAL